MTDPALKIALAMCVLLTGFCAAKLFRRDPAHVPPAPQVESRQQVLLRQLIEGAEPVGRRRAARRTETVQRARPIAASGTAEATVLTPLDRYEPPPAMSPEFPHTAQPVEPRRNVSLEMMLPSTMSAHPAADTHRVVDGDTLADLAERYLGSADRADELFQANRDILADPGLLPIGIELKLPPGNGPAVK